MSVISLVITAIFSLSLTFTYPAKASSIQILDSSASYYGQVQVIQKDGYKCLLVDGIGQNYVKNSSRNEISYINFMSALPIIRKSSNRNSQNSLVIGLGAGQLPMLLSGAGSYVETVEINPVIDSMARKHFGFNHKEESVHFSDGRLFLSQNTSNYDYIFIDAFNSDQIAWHLLSREALETGKSRLKKFGILAINVTSTSTSKDIASMNTTLKSVFPYVHAFDEDINNELTSIVFLASESPIELNTASAELTPAQIVNIQQYLTGELNNLHNGTLLTDNFNPIGYQRQYTQLLWRKAMRDFLGGDYYGAFL